MDIFDCRCFQNNSYNIGFSKETLEEEDIAFMQLVGLYPLNKYYTAYYQASLVSAFFTFGGMLAKCFMDGRIDYSFETAHVVLISVNMLIQIITYNYHQEIVEKLLRSINNKFFSYGDTMDENTKNEINELAKKKRARKKMYGTVFKLQVTIVVVGLIVKPPILYLINGHGVLDVDGENWLIFQSPVKIYFPMSNYWVGYVIGHAVSYNSTFTIALAAMGSALSFMRFSEELLHQLQIVKLGLRDFLARANYLYTQRYGRSYLLNSDESYNDFDMCISTCLIKSVEHHAMIIKLFEDFKKLMLIPLFTVIFDGSALICMSTVLLLMSEVTALKMSMPPFIVAECFYTYLYCHYGEKLTNLFSEIGDQMYLDDWFTHSKVVKPYMTIIRAYSFYPKKLSAGGFTSPNLQSFGNVLRTAYSLLNFLLTRR